MEKPFLTAEWRKLINLTFEVHPEMLTPYLPKGVELALINGNAHVSLVAFDFLDTKVLGFPIPFHINFPEINLRFYVKHEGNIGVVFIKEFVPKFMIAKVARWSYNEPYSAIPMRSEVVYSEGTPGRIAVAHNFKKDGRAMSIKVEAENVPFIPNPDSLEHYFKEHEWGFGQTRSGTTLKYRVEHPIWEAYPVKSAKLDVDFGVLYGHKWSFLNDDKPILGILAEGSAIKVFKPSVMG